jgi:3-hydroxybutyrate dehydrogenase
MNRPLASTDAATARPLQGRRALVTGSTSGIGLAVARALAAQGADVVLNGFGDAQEIAREQAQIASEFSVRAAFSGADMSSPEAIGQMFDQIAAEDAGRLDILVNNAGVQHVAPIAEFPPAQWDRILGINLTAAFHTMRRAIPLMRAGGFGRIVNIASAHGLVASPFKSAYVAAKHGLIGLTKTAALETAEEPITCNAICPGYVFTPLVEAQIADQARAHGIAREAVIRDVLLAQQPNKRFASVEEIGAVVAFLCGEAAASITGAAIPVDGGWTAH